MDSTVLLITVHPPHCLHALLSVFQVVLKIVKHCRESAPATVTGQLMGLDVNGVLEVTHSFPMPKNQESEDFEGKGCRTVLVSLAVRVCVMVLSRRGY